MTEVFKFELPDGDGRVFSGSFRIGKANRLETLQHAMKRLRSQRPHLDFGPIFSEKLTDYIAQGIADDPKATNLDKANMILELARMIQLADESASPEQRPENYLRTVGFICDYAWLINRGMSEAAQREGDYHSYLLAGEVIHKLSLYPHEISPEILSKTREAHSKFSDSFKGLMTGQGGSAYVEALRDEATRRYIKTLNYFCAEIPSYLAPVRRTYVDQISREMFALVNAPSPVTLKSLNSLVDCFMSAAWRGACRTPAFLGDDSVQCAVSGNSRLLATKHESGQRAFVFSFAAAGGKFSVVRRTPEALAESVRGLVVEESGPLPSENLSVLLRQLHL